MKPTYEQLQEQLENAKREFLSADITMQNPEAQLKQSKIDADCYKKGMEASNARLVEIAAELSAIDAIHNDAVFITDDHYEQCPPEVQKIIGALAVLQIPAYQSFLAEVRARAIDSIVVLKTKQLDDMHPDTYAFGSTAMSIRNQINELQVFAAQLRKGGAE
ncbi:hypothetical protein [Citrobacter farmeri]|uniref:hypothetical protein n=1 Tax=Citrobacter farmeri TaxID=67824 RepID=UPI00189FF391|nr:hypothetical protein [Citrobacter farmeri]